MPRFSPSLFLIACAVSLLPAPARADSASPPLQRIAFGSCARQDRPQPIWDAVVAAKPQLFLFLGDNIYADTADMKVMRAKYAQFAAMPGYQKMLKTCPVMATWDDHDFGANDAGADYAKKAESQQLFLDFFGEPKDSPRRKQEGVYQARVFGPEGQRVQVILLDTRYFRSKLKTGGNLLAPGANYVANNDPEATILGEVQWRWLEEQLRVPAEVRLLGSSIQVVAEDHGFEKWMNFPRERERLYQALRDTKAAGVVLLSGDRHLAELSMMDAGIGYPLYDLTASGLNQGSLRWRRLETNKHRVATMNQGNNFGLITIDWQRKDPLLGLQIRDEDGDVTIQEKVRLSLLQPGVLTVKSPAEKVAEKKPNGDDQPEKKTDPTARPEPAAPVVKLASGPRLAIWQPLTLAEAAKNAGKEVLVEMTVHSTGRTVKGLMVFLNSNENYRSEGNFTVVLDEPTQQKLKEAGVEDARTYYQGKTVRVSGTIALYHERPEIMVTDPRQIQVVRRDAE